MGILLLQHNKICSFCGKEFTTNYIRSKFCSKECSYKNGKKKLLEDKKNNPKKYINSSKKYKDYNIRKKLLQGKVVLSKCTFNCEICNSKYKPNTANQKYCSSECRRIAENRRVSIDRQNNKEKHKKINNDFYRRKVGYEPIKEINCVICGNKFYRSSIRQKYCKDVGCKNEWLRRKGLEKYYNNKEDILKRRKNNVNYCIMNKLRMRISCAVKSQGAYKADKTKSLIGCTVKELKDFLEKQFDKDMTWSNYGFYGWHIDHIIPCSKFDLTKEEEQRECFHYRNLQPLWARDNLMKSNKVLKSEVI